MSLESLVPKSSATSIFIIYINIYLSIYLSVCLSIYLSIYSYYPQTLNRWNPDNFGLRVVVYLYVLERSSQSANHVFQAKQLQS